MEPPRSTKRVGAARWVAMATLATVLAGAGAAAEAPMDLADDEARWVSVRFEMSPVDRPRQVDAVYSAPLRGWLEPAAEAVRRLTIPAASVETLLADEDPVPGTFSDFVWSFDPETGHVLSATLEGRVVRTLDWRVATTRTAARLRFRMDTLRAAGYRAPRRMLGETVMLYCDPGPGPGADDDCAPLHPRRYDPETGYVHAVGPIDVQAPIMRMRTLSTLSEARFSEWAGPALKLEAASDARPAEAARADLQGPGAATR